MDRKEKEKYYQKFLEVWGLEAQIKICIEEMSELTKALCKYMRFGEEKLTEEMKYNILEEIADVCNTVEQLEYHFGKEKIEEIKQQKLLRAGKRLGLGDLQGD